MKHAGEELAGCLSRPFMPVPTNSRHRESIGTPKKRTGPAGGCTIASPTSRPSYNIAADRAVFSSIGGRETQFPVLVAAIDVVVKGQSRSFTGYGQISNVNRDRL